MNLDTGEPTDEVLPQATAALEALGCTLTKPSEIAQQKVEAVYKKIQEGLDKANEKAVSNAQRVRIVVSFLCFILTLLYNFLMGRFKSLLCLRQTSLSLEKN